VAVSNLDQSLAAQDGQRPADGLSREAELVVKVLL
jgi:hypothetical protein